MWLQRPPTAMYWKRGWQVLLHPPSWFRNLTLWVQRLVCVFFANSFMVWALFLVIPGVMLAMRRRMNGHDA
jgi:hypothetical protein